nr:uncharacterized protein LOC113724515 [Coffea arabica]
MGFSERWINWIWQCLSTVSYSFKINGDQKGFVTPKRGIRQGDPLSPYLFLICSEGLSNLLRRAEASKLISGISISRRGPSVSHLFFADDTLVFCKASPDQAEELMNVLVTYERGSGQMVNYDKSSVFFSKNTPEGEKVCCLQKVRKCPNGKPR